MTERFLIITNKGYPTGLWSAFVQVVSNLWVCEEEGITPIVFFRDNWLFYEDGGWHGATNPWEYYFEPVSDHCLSDLTDIPLERLRSARLMEFWDVQTECRYMERCAPAEDGAIHLPAKFTDFYRFDTLGVYGNARVISDELQARFADIVRRRIRLKPHVQTKVDDFAARHFAGKVVGIHLRGKEHSDEYAMFLRMRMPPLRAYFREIDRYLADNPGAKVFVATDTKSYLEAAKRRYGDRLVHYESTLSDDGQAPHKQFGGAKVGEDVCVDALLLSRCDRMIHGLSHVTAAAKLFRPELECVDICRVSKQRLPFWLSVEAWFLKLCDAARWLVRRGWKLNWLQRWIARRYFRDPKLGYVGDEIECVTRSGRVTRWSLFEKPGENNGT